MSNWNSNPFSDGDPWFTVWKGGARRRPKSEEDANTCDEDLQPEAQPGPIAADEESEARPISLFKKAGWVEAETKFKSQATLFAEFQIHPALKDRPVEFQLLRRKDGAFVHDATALGKPDASGRATVTVPIHKEYSESDTFRIQARHGGMAWSNSRNTDREVRETAEDVFEHKAVSGIHFPENSSFIVPAYLTTFRELDKTFTDWRRTHPNAKLVVFGHAERNEEDPRKLSERRAKIAFAFLIGDHFTWGDIAKEEKWGVWEQQHMLQALGFYKEKVDGIKGPKTDKAILDFITWLNETECKGINPMLGFTEEYIRLELYRVYITGSKRAVSIPSGYFRTVSGYPNVGCTAFNRYKGGDGNHGENRRATFLMLEESLSFPVTFPCRSTVGPCEAEAGKAGERTIKGFECRFYDRLVMEVAGTKDVFPFTGTGRNGSLDDPLILRVLFLGGVPDNTALKELKEILDGKHQVSRGHCARNLARAIQRALIFLSYPTGSQGTYSIDGDFGHGTNKGFAHFLREWNKNLLLDEQGAHVPDEKLIMPASYTTVKDAVSQLSTIPVKREGMQLLLDSIVTAAEKKEVYLGDAEKSIENVDQIDKRAVLTVHEIITKYRDLISSAAEYGKIRGFPIKPQWIAAIVETETGGLPRPKFEHHWLYSYYSGKSRGGVVNKGSLSNIRECRFLSTSFGMGQLMGGNYTTTPLASNANDLYYMDEGRQFKVIVDFLRFNKKTCSVVLEDGVGSAAEVEACVRTYNGPSYRTNDYHNVLFNNLKEARKKW